ncbi:N-acetylmuramoyl-L-alanine amidase, partial [Streptomyces tanashiensis]
MGALASVALLLPLLSAAPPAGADVPEAGVLQGQFARAAERQGVPVSVLLAVSYLQSRWDTHGGAPSVTGGYGPMHLTDAVTALARTAPHHSEGEEDARGDSSRPVRTGGDAPVPAPAEPPERLRTLERASALSGIPAEELRTVPAANIEGGAALLAAAQREAGLPASADPADWYGAVARYSGADDSATAATYADDVFDVIRTGETRTTDSGQVVTLTAAPAVAPATGQVADLGRLGRGHPARGPRR